MDTKKSINSAVDLALSQASEALDMLRANQATLSSIKKVGDVMAVTLEAGGRIFSCGNGGSHCDAMHFAEELTGRYRHNRRALGATAISDVSHFSCVANDFGFDSVFSRFIAGNGKRGDLLLAISTSGKSANCINAVREAKAIGLQTVAMVGPALCPLAEISDYVISTPGTSGYADRVQELHIKVIHILIDLIEKNLGIGQIDE